MGKPTDTPRSSPGRDRSTSSRPRRGRLGRRFTKLARNPADGRRFGLDASRRHSGPELDVHSWFHWRLLLVIGGGALACGLSNLLTLGMGAAPGGWPLALRFLSAGLIAIALTSCILAFRRLQQGPLRYTLLAIAALLAGAAVLGFSI